MLFVLKFYHTNNVKYNRHSVKIQVKYLLVTGKTHSAVMLVYLLPETKLFSTSFVSHVCHMTMLMVG